MILIGTEIETLPTVAEVQSQQVAVGTAPGQADVGASAGIAATVGRHPSGQVGVLAGARQMR